MIPSEYAQYEKVVTVGCVSYNSVWGDKAANIAKMTHFVEEAAALGCNIVVFPEMALSGYECEEPHCQMHPEASEPVSGPSTQKLAQVAAQHNLYISFGMPEIDPASGRRYNTAVMVGPDGVVGFYRKLHVAGKEALCYAGGDRLPLMETRYGPVGLQICADFWNSPELSRLLVLKGARLLLCSTASLPGPGKPQYIVQQTCARAAENRCFAASADMVGKDKYLTFFGHSIIAGTVGPRRVVIFAEGDDKEGVVCATLSFEALHRSREVSGILDRLRLDIITREYSDVYAQREAGKVMGR